MSICPICGAEASLRPANKAFPFCNARCKAIDLGKWLSDEYRVPVTSDEDEDGDGGESGSETATPEGSSDMRH